MLLGLIFFVIGIGLTGLVFSLGWDELEKIEKKEGDKK